MPKKTIKTNKVAKTKKVSILQSAIKNVQGKLKVKSSSDGKGKKLLPCSLACILVIFIGLFALCMVLMFYFQNDNLWSGCAKVEGNRGTVNQQLAPVALANPASEFCAEKGGQWKTWNNQVGESGICYFSEFRQCEEWAMYRGDCPVGGADLSQYFDNKAKQYCLMSGGQIVNGEDCTLSNGVTCNLVELLRGVCQP
jgi:hypothetical protein